LGQHGLASVVGRWRIDGRLSRLSWNWVAGYSSTINPFLEQYLLDLMR
jgi:hypothetical protein